MNSETYGHTPVYKAFTQRDVYGVGKDEERSARSKVRIAIVGGGGVAQSKYLPALARLKMLWEPVELVAVVEPRELQARKIAATYAIDWFPDVGSMLTSSDLDAVVILSPDDLHTEHTLACLECGLHVLVEKPMATCLVDADAMCRAAESASRILMVVANKRFAPPYRRARRLIDAGAIHEIASFSGKFNLGYDYVDLLEGGTIHLFDLIRFMVGDVAELSAIGIKRFPTLNPLYPLDNVTAIMRFQSGAIGTFSTSASALSLKPWERVEIVGRHAWLTVEDQYELILYESEEGAARSWKPVMPNTLLFDEEFGGYLGLLENFLQAIRGAEIPAVSGWDGYRALELLSAVQLSILTHDWIALPLDAAQADAWVANENINTSTRTLGGK